MEYKLVIEGELPSLNEYIKSMNSNRYRGNNLKQDTQEYIMYYINMQLHDLKITKPVEMHYTWFCKDKKKDKDNISAAQKFILDALVKSGVLVNDGWKEIAGFTHNFTISKERPRVEIILQEIENE